MRVLLTSEARFERAPDGSIWASAPNGAAMWSRHLDVFSDVLVLARIAHVREPSKGYVRASAQNVAFCALPPYSGFEGLVRSGRHVQTIVGRAVAGCPAIVVRSPSPIAYLAARTASWMRRPFGAQIVGDPDQVFSRGAFRHPLRGPLRLAATSAQRQIARLASVVIYVTRNVLQRKYPATGRVFSGSDVGLDDAAFAESSGRGTASDRGATLVTVAGLDQPYKGIAVLLDAVGELRRASIRPRLLVVGGGLLLGALQARAHALGLESDVEFVGQLDREGVRRALDSADLFVLPSLTEGLPRALLEAMARGLPAVATHVGGVPELLPASWLVPPRDAKALASRIGDVLADPVLCRTMGERNREVARAYHDHVQDPIRRSFMQAVREISSATRCEAACA
jgi:glycosyltransferase involved in cell wall biosynthesis